MASESPQARRRPTGAKLGDTQRNSNVVRASVLESAVALGFGQNSTVANWIFNNPLSEEAEDLHPEADNQGKYDTKSDPAPLVAEAITPTFTSGSNSTSDESSSLNSPGNNAPSAAVTTIQVHTHKPSVTESPQVHFGDFSSDQLQLFSPLALSPHDTYPGATRKILLGKLSRDAERSRSQDDSLHHDPIRDSPSPGLADTGYTSEGLYRSQGKERNGKDKLSKPKANKGSKPKALDARKPGEKDGDYASDGGYLSASSNKSLGKSPGKVKSRAMAFFRRRPKKSAHGSDNEDEDSIPPVPAIPILPRPSSPKLLERRPAPSSPTRSGFSPLTLNLTNPPASPPRRRVSKSPPPAHVRTTPPQQSGHFSVPRGTASPLVASTSAPTVLTPAATAVTYPPPSPMPSTPLSTASFPTTSPSSTQLAAGAPKSLTTSSSRQHLNIPPPGPPPTLPLPRPPPSPSISYSGTSFPLPATPTTPSRKVPPTRSIPVVPTTPGSTRPLTPRRTASPFRPLLSPRASPAAASHVRNGEFLDSPEGDQPNGKEATGRQRSGTALSAGLGNTPAFLQRRIQHGPPPSPRHPPPDVPLPPSPCPTPITRPRTPIGSPSKFHEHFSSVSSVPSSRVLSTPASMSPSPSTATLSESSSGPSVRSSHISSASGRSREPPIRDSLNTLEYSRPTTSTSTTSEVSYGQPIPSTLGRPAMGVKSQFSNRSDVSSSIYSQTMHRDSGSVITYDDDNADVNHVAPKSFVDDDDDDASVYTSEDKTAGRRTMYLMEYGELGENGDEIVIAGSRYWGGHQVPPPLPPLPPMPIRPGPGYF